MPRKARQQSSTGYYHIILRGINREYIFERDYYKEEFIKYMKIEETEGRLSIAAWCIMDNHAHLLLKASLGDLATAVKIICLKYAAYYNRKQKRVGPVFGDRYKNENIENDRYLLGVLRYIHNNPVKSKIVEGVHEHSWSSYKYYINENGEISKREKDFILGMFDNSLDSFIEFHKQESDYVYLDVKEDLEAYKIEIAQNIIKDFIAQEEIIDVRELKNNSEQMSKLTKKLRKKSALTLRQIAELTGQSLGKVYENVEQKES